MPDSIKRAAMIDPNEFNSSDWESAQILLQTYEHFKEDIRKGKYALTQKFWLLYMDLIQYQLLDIPFRKIITMHDYIAGNFFVNFILH